MKIATSSNESQPHEDTPTQPPLNHDEITPNNEPLTTPTNAGQSKHLESHIGTVQSGPPKDVHVELITWTSSVSTSRALFIFSNCSYHLVSNDETFASLNIEIIDSTREIDLSNLFRVANQSLRLESFESLELDSSSATLSSDMLTCMSKHINSTVYMIIWNRNIFSSCLLITDTSRLSRLPVIAILYDTRPKDHNKLTIPSLVCTFLLGK